MTTVKSLKKQHTRQLHVLKAGSRLSIFVMLPLVAVLYISTNNSERSIPHFISSRSTHSNEQRLIHTTNDLTEALLEGKKESILQKKKEEAKPFTEKKEFSHHKVEKESKKDERNKTEENKIDERHKAKNEKKKHVEDKIEKENKKDEPKPQKEKDYWREMLVKYNSTLELPLKPPYRIWAFGQPRTGSTFLLHLLDAIVSVKSPPGSKVFFSGFQGNSHEGRHWYENDSFVIRSHIPPYYYNEKSEARKVFEEGKVAIFTSLKDDGKTTGTWRRMTKHALYTQWRENLFNCSICEVDNYKDIFNMTNGEVKRVKEYMKTYEIIRKCCGLQMSKWEMKRLHGCNITEADKKRPDYPHCELIDKQEVELKLAGNVGGIPHHAQDDQFNWKWVGDCKKFDDRIIAGKGFNGGKFKGCDAKIL
ncbi:hypothetical protein CTEN210_01069 [Chaetoceros tenuissimus]|uniref:Uncharacterized protein n=1 Tax=Chaetoceros tenuissimus TaxID=426638 RepID=A0AAD3CHA1_9STRA|nr:hypothetical protein CTEN210_01069 [Chaetoceros tenuissimus]